MSTNLSFWPVSLMVSLTSKFTIRLTDALIKRWSDLSNKLTFNYLCLDDLKSIV